MFLITGVPYNEVSLTELHYMFCTQQYCIIRLLSTVFLRFRAFPGCTLGRKGVHFSGVAYVLNGRTFGIFGSVHYIVGIRP